MIKINELRQGNLVLLFGKVISWDWSLVAEGANVLFDKSGSVVTAEPVPLSEAILMSFQFARKISRGTQPDCTIVESVSFHIRLNGYEIMVRDFVGDDRGWRINIKGGGYNPQGQVEMNGNRRVDFAHDLQNLIYAITGQELC